MNETSPQKHRRRVFARVAAATAAIVGAALLTTPGTAAAQTDCADLGDDPMSSNPGTAVDTAIACGVEVRLSSRTFPHLTVAATPDGEFHLTATVDPSQHVPGDNPVDTTLEIHGDSLTSTVSIWGARLPYSADAAFLLWTGLSKLTWDGTVPVPEYSGSTAVYDELATGLDLTAQLGANSAEFRFAVEDPEAWDALSSGLGTGIGMDSGDEEYSVVDDALRLDSPDYPSYGSERSTTFTIRDAEGLTATAGLALEEDGSLQLSLPESDLTYPLALSTQWAHRGFMVNEWGSVTSAAPSTAVYRGLAGLDDAYFAAAGAGADAVAGTYCDAMADISCATAFEAETYWGFQWPVLEDVFGTQWEELSFPVSSAAFSVDAAEGAPCVAPELQLTGEYTPAVTWSDRPDVIGAAGTGACQDGTAVYDVAAALDATWGEAYAATGATFAMANSGTTARFDGGSARLEVYFDAAAFRYDPPVSTCSTTQSTPEHQGSATPAYGGFFTRAFRSEIFVPDLSWTATFTDSETGETVLTTDPAEPVLENRPTWRVDDADAFDDGYYEVAYEFTSVEGDFTFRSEPCYFAVDTAAPDLVSIEAEGGTHYVGDEVQVSVEVADAGYPDGQKSLRVTCLSSGCEVPGTSDSMSVTLTDGSTASFPVSMDTSGMEVPISVSDEALNTTTESVGIQVTHNHRDYNGDRLQDLFAVREADGALLYYAGKGDGTFASGVSNGTGWGGLDVVMAGDLTGDGKADLLARDTKTGMLYTYPGNGAGGIGTRITIATGWNALGAFTSAGDFNSDGKSDLYAVGKSDGKLYFYPGTGNGKFGARSALGSGWGVMDTLTAIGDVDRDGHYDLFARDSRTGTGHLYFGNGSTGLGDPVAVPATLDGSGSERYSQITAAGDQDGDGYEDLVAVDSRTGELDLHSFAEDGSVLHPGITAGSAWGGLRLPSAATDRTYDYNGNGATDVLARNGSTGTTYLYPGNGSGGFGTAVSWGSDLAGLNLIETAGDFTGDNFPDLLGRTASGVLYVYPGSGNGGYDPAARIRIGGGWDAMSAIVGGHDYNGDGKADIIARESATGNLWLYPGTGAGNHSARVLIGTGWGSLSLIAAVGDLDHDGVPDVLARKADNCLYVYAGKPGGGLKNGVQLGCGWDVMNTIAAVGDFNGDGYVDWIARLASNGSLYLYKGNGAGSYSASTVIGTGWSSMNPIA